MITYRAVPLVMLLAASAGAQDFTETQHVLTRDGYAPQLNMVRSWPISSSSGFGSWILVGKNAAEATVGGYWKIDENSTMFLHGGIEKHEHPWRVRGGVSFVDSRLNMFGVVEDGGSGVWFLHEGNYALDRQHETGIGWRLERFVGLGPRVQTTIPKSTLTFGEGRTIQIPKILIWVVPFARDIEDSQWKRSLGLRLIY